MRGIPVVLLVFAVSTGQTPSRPIALTGATVVDVSAFGKGTADLRDAVVLVDNGRIRAVGPRRTTSIPRGAEVIDATGKFIVPGLIDAFATINNQAYANAFLYMGVTAIVGLDEPGGRRGTELQLLVAACLTPRQALAAATGNVGAAFGWDVGQIRLG